MSTTYNKDLNYELTQNNQRLRIELSNYRNEMIKLRHELLKQREVNALLKNSLTSEFLKVSKSLNIIFKILENSCNDSVDESSTSINNSLSIVNSTNYSEGRNKNDTTNKQDNIGITSSTIRHDSNGADDLSNFSFNVDNEEGIPFTEPVNMNISEGITKSNLSDHCDEDVPEETSLDENAMPIIQEETEGSQIELSVCSNKGLAIDNKSNDTITSVNEVHQAKVQLSETTFNESSINESDMSLDESISQLELPIQSNNKVRETIVYNKSSMIEDSFTLTSTPNQQRNSTEIKPSPSKIPLRNCSVLLHSIDKIALDSNRLSFTDNASLVIPKKEKLSINSKENMVKTKSSEKKSLGDYKSPVRRLPKRKAAPKVLVEMRINTKMRRN